MFVNSLLHVTFASLGLEQQTSCRCTSSPHAAGAGYGVLADPTLLWHDIPKWCQIRGVDKGSSDPPEAGLAPRASCRVRVRDPAGGLQGEQVSVAVQNGAQRHVRRRRRRHQRNAVLRLRPLRLAVRAFLRHLRAHAITGLNSNAVIILSGFPTTRKRSTVTQELGTTGCGQLLACSCPELQLSEASPHVKDHPRLRLLHGWFVLSMDDLLFISATAPTATAGHTLSPLIG